MEKRLQYDQYISPYHKVHHSVSESMALGKGLIVALTVGVAISCLLTYLTLPRGLLQGILMLASSTLVFSLLSFCLFLVYRGLGYGISETEIMSKCLNFLDTEINDRAAIDAIRIRAEIGSSVSPIRALVPVLVIPISITLLHDSVQLSPQVWVMIGVILLFLILPLASDTYQVGVDSIIRHAIAEYCYLQIDREADNQRANTLLLLHLLQTMPRRSDR